ncbi:protein kinase family protein [Pedobacter frigidisoli]|uniref:protein kinase family protein n=1 Tax=Pedobacter frigidisoli TaxID=2530455 RepID=UPI00292E0A7D|nr:protein kinase family protein [Pedobacter frigidisoli]
MKDDIIPFLRIKDYKFIKDIGQGGLGKTYLIQDELIDENFVCKKYTPMYDEHKELYYDHFVDEIKLLHLLFHINVVRVFNFYLYPVNKTGYILMEYVDGSIISDYLANNPHQIDQVFVQVISGFRHLEEHKILHRDIRPENIMVSKDGYVKIIDFGFGKKVLFDEDFDKSISLNWRYPTPMDFAQKKYNYATEIYFIGKLFEEILSDNGISEFAYKGILHKMTTINPEARIQSFFDLERLIIEGGSSQLVFDEEEKKIYRNFAIDFSKIYSKVETTAQYIKDPAQIIKLLEEAYTNSMLETTLQNVQSISRCFIKGAYYFNNSAEIIVDDMFAFLQMIKRMSPERQKIIINNLWQRLDRLPRYTDEVYPDDDDLPF